ncbi:MAG: hypothetical protein IT307_13215 [Chloroflexi bacterium]|nr:hypothetical protein [Chloroflexota bacterium]
MPALSILPRLRQLGSTLIGNPTPSYTSREVRRYLRPGANAPLDPSRQQAALDVAAVPGRWMHRLDEESAWQLGLLAHRLPTVVALFASGTSLEEIGRRAGGWSAWSANHALETACACIAASLNN